MDRSKLPIEIMDNEMPKDNIKYQILFSHLMVEFYYKLKEAYYETFRNKQNNKGSYSAP